jgi:hypothetical protein
LSSSKYLYTSLVLTGRCFPAHLLFLIFDHCVYREYIFRIVRLIIIGSLSGRRIIRLYIRLLLRRKIKRLNASAMFALISTSATIGSLTTLFAPCKAPIFSWTCFRLRHREPASSVRTTISSVRDVRVRFDKFQDRLRCCCASSTGIYTDVFCRFHTGAILRSSCWLSS